MKKSSEVTRFASTIKGNFLSTEFQSDTQRASSLSISACGIKIDFSKQLWTRNVVDELISHHLKDGDVLAKIRALFNGDKINTSENRAVKHFLLRAPVGAFSDPDLAEVVQVREQFLSFAQNIYQDESIKTVVNIGIGGSDLGPLMTYQALSPGGKDAFFVSNVDPADLSNVLEKIDLDSTIFVVVSKTFTTQETMLNAQRVRELIVNKYGIDAIAKKFVAVSTNLELCKAFGISSDRIFGFWDWVGGRYSLSSAVGLSLAMCFGRETFTQLLAGMHDFDKHLQNASPDNNLAIWHAICNVYNINYLDFDALAVIAYSSKLKEFASYLQQLIMESNGKSVNLTNEKITYKTSPIIFGEPGTNSQHSFFQALHQGTTDIPIDFIIFKPEPDNLEETELVANALAQAAAFAFGTQAQSDLTLERQITGNRPSSLILIEKLDAYSLGVLIALYEASTIVQGFIWNINSFDQWGVQLGKKLASNISQNIKSNDLSGLDSSTAQAIKFLF